MARKTTTKKKSTRKKKSTPARTDSIRHSDTRINIPTEELRDFVKKEENAPGPGVLYQFFRTVEMTRAHGLVCRHCGSRSVAPCEKARAELGLREAARRLQDIRNRGQTCVRPVGVRENDS